MVDLAEGFGFRLSRIRGSHHIFVHPETPELVNFQEMHGQAKPYQIHQFLRLVEWHNLTLEPRGGRMKDYHSNVFWSDEDRSYVADIPDLAHCSAFGDTPQEALAEVMIAREAWLEAAAEAGKPIPRPRYRLAIYQAAGGWLGDWIRGGCGRSMIQRRAGKVAAWRLGSAPELERHQLL